MDQLPFLKKEEIKKGWSKDKKYCVTDLGGTRYLLRLAAQEQLARKELEFAMLEKVMALGVPICQPLRLGACTKGVYFLQSWIEGEDAEKIMPRLGKEEAYQYGLEAGHFLKRIHSLPAPDHQREWAQRFNEKVDLKIANYEKCPLQYEGGEAFVSYINRHRHLLKNRPQVFQHGDYHIGNMMIDGQGRLVIIDFDRYDFGDPWEEFNRIAWSAQSSPSFATGIIHGYFQGEAPLDFWQLLALYTASNTLSSISWALPFGEPEITTMLRQAQVVLGWYDHMRNPVPSWFLEKPF